MEIYFGEVFYMSEDQGGIWVGTRAEFSSSNKGATCETDLYSLGRTVSRILPLPDLELVSNVGVYQYSQRFVLVMISTLFL